jgi:hypothetical protein
VTGWTKNFRALGYALALTSALQWLAGCGGAEPVQVAGGGQDGTGVGPDVVVSGVITGLGSAVVGGIRFDTAGAAITIDGVPGKTQADLQVGMVVTVSGKLNANATTGVASKVSYSSVIRGVIDQVVSSGSAKTLSILGQPINVDGNTQILAAADSPLQVGQFVEVSGYRLSSGGNRATWINANNAAASTGKVSGIITNVTANSFRINGLVLNIAGAQISNVPPGGLREGLLALVQLAGPAVNGQANAQSVEIRTSELGAEVNRATAQGIVCFVSTELFFIGYQEIKVFGETAFVGGTLANLKSDINVRVDGVTDKNGILQATTITFLDSMPNAEINASIAAIDQANSRLTLLGAPGVVATVSSDTLLSDTSAANADGTPRPLAFSQLRVGDQVQVIGVAQNANEVRATVLKKRAPTVNAALRGTVQSAANPALTLLGVPVQTTASSVFIDTAGNPVSQNEFFALLSTTSVVEVQGAYAAGVFNAGRLTLIAF